MGDETQTNTAKPPVQFRLLSKGGSPVGQSDLEAAMVEELKFDAERDECLGVFLNMDEVHCVERAVALGVAFSSI